MNASRRAEPDLEVSRNAVTIPITSPLALKTGPPEKPLRTCGIVAITPSPKGFTNKAADVIAPRTTTGSDDASGKLAEAPTA